MSVGPFIRTPFTDLGAALYNHQVFDKCNNMEMNAMECLEAYGMIRGQKKCADLLEDFMECRFGTKQHKRYVAMRIEREKQIKEGKLPPDQHYAKPPVHA